MKKQTHGLVASMVAAALSVAAAGCLGGDPNMNSMYIQGGGGSSGGGTGGRANVDAGSVMGPIIGAPLGTFAVPESGTGLEGFAINTYPDTSNKNLGDGTVTPAPTLTLDPAEGSPEAGSLKLTTPYSGANQYIDVQHMFGTASLQDWTGKKLHVRFKVDQGFSFGGGAQLYALTTTNYVFGGTFTNSTGSGNWQEAILDLALPMSSNAGFDASKVISYGVQFNSGNAGATQQPVTFHIDSFSLE